MNTFAGHRVKKFPRGMTAMGLFLLFGAILAFLAGTTLLWRGTPLDRIWALNPRAYKELAPFGVAVGIPFLLLSFTLAVASIGWFKYRPWGWGLAVAIIATQVLGNLVNIWMAHYLEGGIGIAIAGALLLYLLRADVKSSFVAGALDK
jgi:hypothetical protein